MKKDNFTRVINWIALLVSFATLIIVLVERYPRTDLSFDYMGIIIGVLSILVTILITWNIAQALSIEKKIRSAIDAETEKTERITVCLSLAKLGEQLYNEDKMNYAIWHFLEVLKQWKKGENELEDTCAKKSEDYLCKILAEYKITTIATSCHEDFVTVANKCNNRSLMESISKVTTTPDAEFEKIEKAKK